MTRNVAMQIEDSGQQLTKREDIFRVLRSLQLTRSLLTLRFAGDHHAYSSLLIHTDLEKQQFIIDELSPANGNEKLKSGQEFTLIAFYEGIQVTFSHNRIIAASAPALRDAYAVVFPKSIHQKQRRNAYRANLHQRVQTAISLHASVNEKRNQPLSGKVVDLSTTGIGCQFEGFVKPEILADELFEQCHIRIDSSFELHCGLVAKQPRYDRSQNVTFCGFAFFDLDRIQQRRLDKYTLQIQREIRKANQNSTLSYT